MGLTFILQERGQLDMYTEMSYSDVMLNIRRSGSLYYWDIVGRGKWRMGGNVQGIRSIIGRYKIDRER